MFKTIFLIVLISFFIFKFFLYIFLSFVLIVGVVLYVIKKTFVYIKSIDINEIEYLLKLQKNNHIEFENILNKKAKQVFKYNKLGRKFLKNILRRSLQNYEKNLKIKQPDEIYKYFEIFEFSEEQFENLNIKELKKIYKNLSRKYHPDIEGGSHQKMSLLNNAYEYLYNLKT